MFYFVVRGNIGDRDNSVPITPLPLVVVRAPIPPVVVIAPLLPVVMIAPLLPVVIAPLLPVVVNLRLGVLTSPKIYLGKLEWF